MVFFDGIYRSNVIHNQPEMMCYVEGLIPAHLQWSTGCLVEVVRDPVKDLHKDALVSKL